MRGNIMKESIRGYIQLALVVASAGVIYPIAYIKNNYQETLLEVYNISLQDLNTIFLALGIISVITYFPSGILCDKFSCKWLLVISLTGTAAAGVWFAMVPQFEFIVVIYMLWGIFSILTFWAAHMKLIKLLARPEEQGRFFGILDGGRGLIEAVLGVIAVALFAKFMGSNPGAAEKHSAMVALVWLYTIAIVIVTILIVIFMEGVCSGRHRLHGLFSHLDTVLLQRIFTDQHWHRPCNRWRGNDCGIVAASCGWFCRRFCW